MQPIDILKEDFAQTLGFIDKCHSHMFQVKNWAIITSSTVIAFSISNHLHMLLLANVGVLIPFMYLELMYKSFQDAAIEHTTDISERIDKYLIGPNDNILTGYGHSFGRRLRYPSVHRIFLLLRNPNRRHIINFYLLLGAISVAAFMLAKSVA
jgi:hypothetical protein